MEFIDIAITGLADETQAVPGRGIEVHLQLSAAPTEVWIKIFHKADYDAPKLSLSQPKRVTKDRIITNCEESQIEALVLDLQGKIAITNRRYREFLDGESARIQTEEAEAERNVSAEIAQRQALAERVKRLL